jgi:trans-aconitate 2-methyltransferase
MTSPSWNPQQYLKFEGERARPFDDLIARVLTPVPRDVVDLGCGPGNMTRTLLERWPQARIHGIDSSLDMIAAARRHASDRLDFEVGDLTTWTPPTPLDVIVSNATLQWVPNHVDLLPTWLGFLRPGGTIAFQVPANANTGASDALDAITSSPRWASVFRNIHRAGGLANDDSAVRSPAEYADILGRLGCAVDAWETTYTHVLVGDDAALQWFGGSGLRPYYDALDEAEEVEFRADVAAAFRDVYPPATYGTLFPFRRIFVVAQA